MMDDNAEIDFTLALQLQAQFEEELRASIQSQEATHLKSLLEVNSSISGSNSKMKRKNFGDLDEPPQEKLSVSLIDHSWELIDPNPDLHTLFLTFDKQFFWGRLYQVEVKWSPRMTLCAGVCSYEGRGGLCSIRLSLPLLKLRPRKDMIETLLHEMIHAYLFVTANNRDRDGHGPEFHKHMYRINGVAGTKISVYHSFHDEVDQYRQHIWQCDGPCRHRRPYFGLVKRSMNRVPGPRDPWWGQHQQSCGGSYTKIQEPEGYGVKKKKGSSAAEKKNKGADIRKLFGSTSKDNSADREGKKKGNTSPPLKENIPGYSGSTSNSSFRGTGSEGPDKGKGPSNIHGFGSTATGTVRQVNVNNARRSKVHGFGGSGSPAKKKPRIGGKGTSMGSSGSVSGAMKGGSGIALASRGGGSKTVTVKGKGNTSHQTEKDTETVQAGAPPVTPFKGTGHSLGGPSSGVSRLMSLSAPTIQTSDPRTKSPKDTLQIKDSDNANSQFSGKRNTYVSGTTGWISPSKGKSPMKGKSVSPCPQKSIDKFFKPSTFQPSEPKDESGVKCPVCSKCVSKRHINKHLDECIGDFDDDDNDFENNEKNNKVTKNNKQNLGVNTSDERVVLLSSDDDDGYLNGNTNKVLPCSSRTGRTTEIVTLPEQLFPCPVCNDMFSEAAMNQHLDSHF
ncbi:DNA-dependent metalloprotease SPRTN-like [Penaeus chinensis]|uniref:DNA-dependent metalloprotease SPRTN-like n=1 Tax=Penaeus chinensis TaxID=139456 RepID=UPI001FB57E50|nr:DNA-dependent metalloprotease SPRTN-like [Penaeus chinensis]XP_047493043.1 DNA-dependent metalloprotease SPRTN-like [Penaeus chinensis]XP_047493044.1 DNA-dependent metalloprotease SPRTN-like [Penaeus chinensis]